jgi:hypothetical protein
MLVSSSITYKKRLRLSSFNSKTSLVTLLVFYFISFSIGEVPPHLHKLKTELEKIYDSLERKNELLMSAMMKNFGRTQ